MARGVARPVTPQQRWRQAFARIRAVERRSQSLAQARTRRRVPFSIYGRAAVRSGIEVGALPRTLRPKSGRGDYADLEPTDEVLTAAGADLIRIGKFDVEREVRSRSFYLDPGLSVRFQSGGVVNGVQRSIDAYQHVQRHAPELMPPILDHGSIRRARYLVEQVVPGRHPVGAQRMQALAEQIAAGLSLLHQGVGVTERPLIEILGQRFEKRWRALVEEMGVDEHTDAAVGALVARDEDVAVSLGHGDLVGTNIVTRKNRVTLIDWEYSSRMPIAFDLAKVHLHCAESDAGRQALLTGLGNTWKEGPGRYTFAEQLALANVRFLSWTGTRRARAVAAGRVAQFEATIALRLREVRTLLEID